METRTYNIYICGVGGQGILKASELCGIAAMRAGYHVKKSEVHGMAQRGGSVESHVRFGPSIASPLIPPGQADFLVCFDAQEADRMAFYLKQGGVDFRPFLEKARATLPDQRFLNTYLSGVLSLYLPIEEQVWLAALREIMTRAVEENEKVFLNARKDGTTA